MSSKDYDFRPLSDDLRLKLQGRPAYGVARVMIAYPGTDLESAVRDYPQLLEALPEGTAAGDLGRYTTGEQLHGIVAQRERNLFGVDAYLGRFSSRDGRNEWQIGQDVGGRVQEIMSRLGSTEAGGEQFAEVLRAEAWVEARYQHAVEMERRVGPMPSAGGSPRSTGRQPIAADGAAARVGGRPQPRGSSGQDTAR
ncbi:hypothetical protein [Kribbella sp. NPDC000426]|uniref:hypothetical protein n=1 Tax=Kribbella sp. NPDC000426 TaxID=3154255 RepID=UPI00332D2A97